MRGRLKLDVQGQGGGKFLTWMEREWVVLKNRQISWMSYVYHDPLQDFLEIQEIY